MERLKSVWKTIKSIALPLPKHTGMTTRLPEILRMTKLRNIEQALQGHDKSFGFLTTVECYAEDKSARIEEYVLCIAMLKKYEVGDTVGEETWILEKDKVSSEELVDIIWLFKKLKRELICDLQSDVNYFDVSKYIERIKKLQGTEK